LEDLNEVDLGGLECGVEDLKVYHYSREDESFDLLIKTEKQLVILFKISYGGVVTRLGEFRSEQSILKFKLLETTPKLVYL
jgi:hypothetical protein